ncbi:tetratricopeptide repeat domain-containing protein [Amniculicola lignicola CBS 123094]|uniref:Tetratricopeptide repeat domain-containing protein n=1 Tax=Amniculicola lignicola CBS 123094 TaxID=1392246 RepID=A0A6A5X006_9PLEO|nr:tetratricopeptide repeat domain-containing protein [Amniculicola lignicola CBS 123094]
MADPVSVVAAGIGIADIAVRLITYLKDVKSAAEAIDDDIGDLVNEFEQFAVLHGELEREYLGNVNTITLGMEEKMMWFNVGKTLKVGQQLTQELEKHVRRIYGQSRTVIGRRDGLAKQHRQRTEQPIIAKYRTQIAGIHRALQIFLGCIQMHSSREHHANQESQLEQLNLLVKGLEAKIEHAQVNTLSANELIPVSTLYNDFTIVSLSVLKQIGASIESIGSSIANTKSVKNEHFDTPKPVDQFYTGREDQEAQLSAWLLGEGIDGQGKYTDKTQTRQKRFVIYGVPGAGKTQFCCKFAEDNRDHFWGVFWVDGSNRRRLQQTFSQNVSTIAEVDPNEKAALHWLSNLSEPWLLIIDNADDPTLELDEYFPKGNRGHILITTRDPIHKSYGTVGEKFFEFQELKSEEASCLLLKAAGQERPWDSKLSHIATTIAKTLGFLALAITQAGRTIRQGYCKIHDYLEFYERQWKKTRQRRQPVKTRDLADDLSVFVTFDINRQVIENRHTEASRDALQLLDTFAFMHNQNIRFDILRRAVTNATIENEHIEKEKRIERLNQAANPSQDWSGWWKAAMLAVLQYITQDQTPPVLPKVVSTGRESKAEFDPDRLLRALRQLQQSSLVTHSEKTDSYSVHPLVHKWARERPDMEIGEQAVWSEAAAVLLAHCILIPPLGNTIEDEAVHKYLLPHIDHVRYCQESIEKRMRDRRIGRHPLKWPIFEGGFNRSKAMMYAKFSIVYAQNGHWEEAKRLQMTVKDFTTERLGKEHVSTRRITLALSHTVGNLGHLDDAAALKEQVLDTCIAHLGPNHHDTLVVKGQLGETRYLQGRFTDAKVLLEEAVLGLTQLHGINHEDTLEAIDNLGQTVLRFYTEDSIRKARELHLQAIYGMAEVHGRDHTKTLRACENLCVVATESRIPAHLRQAHEMMTEVLEARKRKLGREHAYTLLAMVNLAIVKRELGDLEAAEGLITQALPTAERNLSPDHQGCLWGRFHLAWIWIEQEKWERAEQTLVDVTLRQRSILQGRGRYHPDRIHGLVKLALVYNMLGKLDEYDEVVHEALNGFEKTNASEHPIAKQFRKDCRRWAEERCKKDPSDSLLTLSSAD